jgi:outer membrane lipoprotein-sorting protein
MIAFLAFLIIAVLGVPCFSLEASPTAAPLVDSVIAHQKRVRTLTCGYHHKRFLNNTGPSEFQGEVDFQAPEKLLMHFLFPADEYVLVNDSSVLIYGVKNAYGIRYNKKCLSDAEKQIAEQIGQIKMNMLETMRPSYLFFFSDTLNPEATVLSARPVSGWKNLSKILITVDRNKWYLKSIAIYGKTGERISSTVYSNPQFLDTANVWFPRSIELTLIAGSVVQKDIITYSRISCGKRFSHNHFSIPTVKNAETVDNQKDCK